MVKDKNGNKVTLANLDHLEDFPELEVPEGMSAAEFEEQQTRALFDTEDEYLDYLWQLEHGVPSGMPVGDIEGYIRTMRLQGEQPMITKEELEGLARAATLETGLAWAGRDSDVVEAALRLQESWGISGELLRQGFCSIRGGDGRRLSIQALKRAVCYVMARGLITAQSQWIKGASKSVEIELGSCGLLMGLRDQLQHVLMEDQGWGDQHLGLIAAYLQNHDLDNLTGAVYNLLDSRALMGHKPVSDDEGDTAVHMYHGRKSTCVVQLVLPYVITGGGHPAVLAV